LADGVSKQVYFSLSNLVTGDRDLLSLKDNFSCPMITAKEFINIFDW